MPGSFFDRLSGLFGRRPAAPPEAAAPTEDASAVAVESPPAEAPVEPTPVEVTPTEEAAPAMAEAAPADVTPAPPVEAPVEQAPVAQTDVGPEPAPVEAMAAPVEAAPAPPAEPAKSAEELLEERLWAETHEAWAQGDFQTVTERLDALKALQPEDAAAIDEKIAAAQYNYAAQIEQSGDLQRALYLYQEAQRRNPNLGEATFAIERVQAALAPPPAPVEAAPAEEAPAERMYTVEVGDSLWAIAEKMYGSGNEWSRIFDANRDQIDNPDMIQPGQTLRIP